MSDALTLDGLVVSRGNRDVVRDVSIEVPPGEVTALLGPNGAGKSSLVLAVGGVLGLKAGSVKLGDRELAGRRPERIRRAGLAIVPEGRRLLPELTVEDNLRVATYSLSSSDAKAGRARALELFPELGKRLRTQARSLSGGEQQMVVLAQALVSAPKFVIIDELSLGLAPVVVQRLIPTIRGVAESGTGVLLIEQFATLALGLANRAYVMEGGRIQYSGHARELRENSQLLHSAYLLRGRGNGSSSTAAAAPGRRMSACTGRHRARARARAERRHRALARVLRAGARTARSASGRRWSSTATGSTPAAGRACISPTALPTARIRGRSGSRCRARRTGAGPVDHIAFSGRRLRRARAAAGGARRAAGPQRRAGRWAPPAVLRRSRRDARRDQRHGSYDEGRCR